MRFEATMLLKTQTNAFGTKPFLRFEAILGRKLSAAILLKTNKATLIQKACLWFKAIRTMGAASGKRQATRAGGGSDLRSDATRTIGPICGPMRIGPSDSRNRRLQQSESQGSESRLNRSQSMRGHGVEESTPQHATAAVILATERRPACSTLDDFQLQC